MKYRLASMAQSRVVAALGAPRGRRYNHNGSLSAKRIVQSIRNPSQPVQLEMQSLGSGPGSLVQVQVPASTPLYARRNSLAGILVAQSSSIVARTHVLARPFARALARQPLVAQRVLSTEPATLLIGSNRLSTLTPLKLDGSRDWIVCRATVDAYAGPALTVRAHTSWAIGGLAPFPHVLVRGRGSAVVATPSTVVSYDLEAGQSVLVQRKYLAAYSLDPVHQTRASVVDLGYKFAPLLPPPPPAPVTAEVVDNTPLRRAWTTVSVVAGHVARGVKKAAKFVRDYAERGNSDFVRVYGPSTVLIAGARAGASVNGEPVVEPSEASEAAGEPSGGVDKK